VRRGDWGRGEGEKGLEYWEPGELKVSWPVFYTYVVLFKYLLN
jgi:hypothetical protein